MLNCFRPRPRPSPSLSLSPSPIVTFAKGGSTRKRGMLGHSGIRLFGQPSPPPSPRPSPRLTSPKTSPRIPDLVPEKHIPGHLYMIHEREFKNSGDEVYKIGRTTEIKGRMPKYPKASVLVTCTYCETNINRVERRLINTFKEAFIHETQYGSEYFRGDRKRMIITFNAVLLEDL